MPSQETEDSADKTEVVVSAPNVEGIATAINARIESDNVRTASEDVSENNAHLEELTTVFEVHEDVVEGLRKATEKDSRGKQRKKVREYSGRDDMENWEFGRHLEVLEVHGIAERDGNRWRLTD
ncbi:hypothetical protein [Halorubrum ezzemoulense]|jgi:hypothetical protein|uniref:hypothetical protein n=1 Tax=Halorubrum ezzemoulense TaxID=337243 RepID=UPI00232CB79F|nr:hypothetical protein [Halorubrum ezzemoulense]MDB9235764.1 hypothetical protein [Halorubrum ezzemoulense]